MLDRVLNEIVEEIALEGDQGCTFDKLFVLLQTLLSNALSSTALKHPLSFNDKYKAYLWNQIKDHNDLIITENDTIIDFNKYSFEELISKSNSIMIKTTEEVQDRSIYGALKNEKRNLTDKHKLLLNVIAQSRSQGITQFKLGEELNMDPKTIFYYLKKMDQLGLIVRHEACASKKSTNIVLLKKYADISDNKDQDDSEVVLRVGEFKENILKALRDAKDNMIGMLDVIRSVGLTTKRQERWARVKISEMHNSGELEKFLASDGNKQKQCLRLVLTANDTSVQVDDNQKIRATKPDKPNPVYKDLPFEYLVYQDIVAAKEKGLTRQDVLEKYPFIDPNQTKSFFENIVIPPKNNKYATFQVYRTEELSGKTRQYRYFSLDGWHEFSKSIGRHIEDEPINQKTSQKPLKLVEPKSIDEISLLYHTPEQPRKRKTVAAQQAPKPVKKSRVVEDTTDQSSPGSTEQELNKRKAPMERHDTVIDFGTPTTNKKAKRAAYDTSKARRVSILLDLLEKQPILVVGPQLMREFHEIEMSTSSGPCIARKTLDDMIKMLHSQSKLTAFVTTINKPYGLAEIKTLLLHSSLKTDSEQVKEFIEQYGFDQHILQTSKKVPKLKVVDMKTLPSFPSPNVERKQLAPGFSSSWRYTAIEHGWIFSKWLRARELHEAMFEYHEKHSGTRKVNMAQFLKAMSLRRLMMIFGVLPYDNPRFAEFLESDANRDIPVNELPPDIRPIVVSAVPKIRLNVIRLLDVLKALGVVESSQDEHPQVYKIESSLTLSLAGNIKDYKIEHHPIREVIQLKTITDVRYFWVQLQTCCTEYSEVANNAEGDTTNPLNNITMRRTWNTNTLITPEQREILDSFIDKKAQTVPDENDLMLQTHIAKKAGLSVDRSKMYYKSMLVAFRKYETKKEKLKKRLESESNSSPVIQELVKASLENRKVKASLYKLKSAEPFVERTYIGSRNIRRLKVTVYHDHGRLTRQVTKDPFSEVEKDVLVYSYCIMKTRAEESNFFWSPISKVIINHTPERCRRVLGGMLKRDPSLTVKISKMKAKWIKIYQEGIRSHELKDDKPWDSVDFDLNTFLEYFLIKLKDESRNQEVDMDALLPNNTSELHRRFDIVKSSSQLCVIPRDRTTNSLFISHEAFYDCVSEIPSFDAEKVKLGLVKTIIKMVLMTPEAEYDSKSAFQIFTLFPENITKRAIHEMKEDGLIVKDKMRYGRVPGRHINVSQRFLDIASGLLPYNFFQQANNFYDKLVNDESTLLSGSSIDGGAVATTLRLLSQGKVILDFQDRAKYIASKQSLNYPKAAAVQAIYLSRGLDPVIQKITPLPKHSGRLVMEELSIPTDDEDTKTSLGNLASDTLLVEHVYQSIERFKERGVSWSDIKEQVKVEKTNVSDEDLRLPLDLLLDSGLVQMTGLDCLRYVAIKYVPAWLLKKYDSDNFIRPLMWYNVSGQMIEPALEGCTNTVMSYIMKFPGISFASLRENLTGFFTTYELHQILKVLQIAKKITSRKVQRAMVSRRALLFNKQPLITTTTKHQGMNDQEITHYWARHSLAENA